MSTANKLTYLNVTKQLLKDKINNLGGSIDEQTTFRQYANQLQGVYDNLPKTEYQEGTEVNLGVTSKGKLDYENGVVGFGQARQNTTTGKNLLNYNNLNPNISGYGIVVDNEGNVEDTSPASDARAFTYANCNWQLVLPAGTYTISMFFSKQITNASGALSMYNYNNQTQTTIFTEPNIENIDNYSKTFTLSEETQIGIIIKQYDGIYKIQLEAGSTATDWEKFTFGASPNPNYEQEIKYVRGRNLINTSETNIHINSSGDLLVSDSQFIGISEYVDCKPNTTYSIIFENDISTANMFAGFKDKNGTFISRTSYSTSRTFTTPSNAYSVFFYVYLSGATLASGGYVQLEEGSQPTSYLPYNTIEEVVSGKNIFNKDSTPMQANGTSITPLTTGIRATVTTAGVNKYIAIKIQNASSLLGKTLTISSNIQASASNNGMVRFYWVNNESLTDHLKTTLTGEGGSYSFDIPNAFPTGSNGIAIVFSSNANGTTSVGDYVDYTNVQLEVNNQATPYEPYIVPTSYQLSLGDKELYDECTIVGSPDNWKFVDNYYKEKINISSRQISNTSGKYRFILGTTYNAKQTPNSSVADIYSNIFIKNSANNNYLRINSIAINDVGEILIYWEDWAEYSVQEMQDYFENRDDYIVYPLATPIETPITDTALINQLNAWYNAHSNNGTTIITSNGNLPMIIKVRGLKGE